MRAITSAPCAPCHSAPGDGVPVAKGQAGVMAMGTMLTRRIALAIMAIGLSWPALAREDFRDVQYLFGVILQRLETQRVGTEVPWMNPETGNRGVVAIDREDTNSSGSLCRDYRRITEVPGEAPIIHSGRGCRDDTGRWRVQPEVAAAPPSVPSPDSSPSPAARTDPEPAPPPPLIPPPGRKPDPDVFFASVPTPSVYR